MSNTLGPGIWEIYEEAKITILEPNRMEGYSKYITDMMNECIRLGDQYGRSGSALGNMKGHWF